MVKHSSFWLIIGLLIGAATGFILENLAAGLYLGAVVGLLTMILAMAGIERKKGNR